MDAKAIEWMIGGPLLIGLLLVSWWAMSESENRLNDPNDDRTVHLGRLREILKLAPFGVYRVTILRQSGNIHAEKIVTGTAQDALETALATLRRAKIDAVHVGANSETELRVGRLYHDHRGSNEGKKVGKAHITLVERLEAPAIQEPITVAPPEPQPLVNVPAEPEPTAHEVAPEPTVSVQFVGLTCDCGERFNLPIDDLERDRTCAACGVDATLTGAQIAQVHQAIADAREQALERYRAGETEILVESKGKLTEAGSGLTAATIRHEAAREAVERLGLLNAKAIPTIVSLLNDDMAEHPRTIATAYRKEGEQLTREEKKAAGIRANAFMSQRAFAELSQKGRITPLAAHETSLLRASFTLGRFRQVSLRLPSGMEDKFAGFKYQTNAPDCPFCSRVDGTVVSGSKVAVLPAADCVCSTANYFVGPHFDWFRDAD